ncbi:MAG: APH(3') family aminoglycoside O-phosphotransferase [Pyrinomonadaceae bacterium]
MLSEIAGVDASCDSLKADKAQTIGQLAKGLKIIHSLPFEDCPFGARLEYKLQIAEKMMRNGLVDESDFDEIRQGKSAEDLFEELIANKPTNENLVFTHGDYCVPNVILKNGNLSGFIDWSGAGVADKYQDIALLARSVASNFGAEWKPFLFDALNVEPDMQKIYFYNLLDEFF